MSKLNTTPTGCPGPIAGTRVWRCDGENCVYGKSYYASCKQAIAERGYTLRLSSDIIAETAEAAELVRQNVQGQLVEERADKERIIKKAEERENELIGQLATEKSKTAARQDLADEFANLYYSEVIKHDEANTIAVTLYEQSEAQCAHCAELLQRIAELEDELLWYKQKVAGNVAEDTASSIDTIDNGDNDSSMLDSGPTGGAVSE